MKTCDLVIHAGLIITQNENRDVLRDASLVINDGKILDTASTELVNKAWSGVKTLNYQDKLIMPGLINAHTHAAMTFMRGVADDLPLMEWLENCVFPVESRLTDEIVQLGSLLGYAEMLATGTTSCIDMYIFEDAVFKAAEIAGLRCMGGEAIFAFPSAACKTWQSALEKTAFWADKYANHPLIKVAVNPHSVYTTTPEILGACRNLASERKLPIHIHLAETKSETARCLKEHKRRPIGYCEEMGLLETRLICAHLVDINRSEAELLAKSNVCGVHNPASNMKLASGASPIAMMQSAGLAVALGTDGPASNNTINMFTEMNRAALFHKYLENSPIALPAQTVLDMATLMGGLAFEERNLGILKSGAPADCIALDLKSPNFQPMHNPVSQVVYAASGHECVMSMVNGKILYENGQYAGFDYAYLLKEINKLKNFVKNKY